MRDHSEAIFCCPSFMSLSSAKGRTRDSATLLQTGVGEGVGHVVTCLALGCVGRHKGWATQNSLAVQ
jgi:hypothetical protein